MSLKKAGLVGLLAAVAFAAVPASAETVDDLQAQIDALMAQLASLQGGSSSSAGCYGFTVDLTDGSTGADVTALQNYLISGGYSIPAGATGYFGAQTTAALAAWQAANGISPAAGYWGPISRAKYSSMCGSMSDDDSDDDSDNDDFFSGDDEGSISVDQLTKYGDEEVGEDDEDVVVLGAEIEADGADQMIERVTVVIDNPSDEDDLEEFIQDVSVWLDDEELARMDVDEADYERSDDEYTFRFVGLDGVVEDGDTADLLVAVTGPTSVNGDIEGDEWDVEIGNNGIRASSPNGVTESYDGVGPEAFSVESFAAANDVELKARKSDDNPEEQTVVGDSDDEFNADILVFELEAEGSDIEVFSLEFDWASSDPNVPDVLSEAILTCDGEEWTETGATTTVFSDLEFMVDEGDSIECVLSAELNELDGTIFAEGTTLSADLDTSETDAEDQSGEGLEAGDLTGSANGNDQTFISEGLEISNIDTDKSADNATETDQEGIGTFTIEFDVTANDSDVYLDKNVEEVAGLDGGAGDGAGDDGEGVVYTLDMTATNATSTAILECVSNCGSASDNTADEFFVGDGDTETYRLTVTVTAEEGVTSYSYAVWIDSINWSTTNLANADQFYTSNLGEDTDADTGSIVLISK